MAYTLNDTAKDQLLDYLKQNVVKVVVLDSDPAGSYSDANTNNGVSTGMKIAEVTVNSADFTIANGATDGRKVTVGAKSTIAVVADGDASHVAWLSSSAVLAVTQLTVNRNGLTTSDTVDIPGHYVGVRDAVGA